MITMGRRIMEVKYAPGMGRSVRRLLEIRQCAKSGYVTARKNALSRGIPFELTADQMDAIIEASNGRCMVTGIPFTVRTCDVIKPSRRPWAPSLDRVKTYLTNQRRDDSLGQ